MKMRNLIFWIMALLTAVPAGAQSWDVAWGGSAGVNMGSKDYLPFWARTGNDGIVPYYTSEMVTLGADVGWGDADGWRFEAGANLAGALAQPPYRKVKAVGLVDRLYVSGSWKMLHLDVGMKPRARELEDISISGGNVVYSRNARNVPGINAWTDWIYFEKGHWFGIKGNLAHYQMIDNRYVKGTMLHNKALSMKVALGGKVDFSFGFEHWAQWGGKSPIYGSQPTAFKDYIRVFLARKGGEDATTSDRINVLGNHLGREYFRVDWRAEKFTLTGQYDKPFEDGSGMRFQNAPDGIWSLQCSFNDREAWVTDVIYEFISTTWQSGTVHDRPATEEEMAKQDPSEPTYGRVVVGGCDNYFSNGEYKSGWTNYNRIMGCPLIIPALPGADGITMDMASTRVRAHHIGLKGVALDLMPYRFLATYSRNYGKYSQSESSVFAKKPQQFSLALEVEFGQRFWPGLPLRVIVGAYGDVGDLYRDSVGATLKVIWGNQKEF